MAILVIEGGHPNGTDLVMSEATSCQEHLGYADVVIDGIAVRLLLRLLSADGKLFALRRVVVMHPDGSRLRKVDESKFIDDVEVARG